jgi:hypothetical protein
MIASSFEVALTWGAGIVIVIAIGRLIWWLISRGHASPGDFFP